MERAGLDIYGGKTVPQCDSASWSWVRMQVAYHKAPYRPVMIGVHSDISQHPSSASHYVLVPETAHCSDLVKHVK